MKEVIKVCDYHGRDNEPCYGKIDEFYDGEKWFTFCEGHQAVPNGGAYVPKDPIRRIIFSQQNAKIRKLEEENTLLHLALYRQNKQRYIEMNVELNTSIGTFEIEIPSERLEILYD